MDSFSASLMLSAIMKGSGVEAVVDFAKGMDKTPPANQDMETAESWRGRRCSIKLTEYTGVVVGANKSTGGFYPGVRFPVLVQIDRTREGGSETFPYSLDQVLLDGRTNERT